MREPAAGSLSHAPDAGEATMRWLPILLMFCGFNAAQAVQLCSIAEMIWLTRPSLLTLRQ